MLFPVVDNAESFFVQFSSTDGYSTVTVSAGGGTFTGTAYSIQYTECSIQHTVYTTEYSIQSTVYSMYIVQYTLYSILSIV